MLRSLTFVAGLLFASHAFAAECALPTAPAVPNGASASLDEMKTAQDSVKKFLADTDDFLKCLDFSHAADADTKHNKAVDQMQKLASNFNDQLKAFKAAHPG
ncbi:MAG TPA: hypothetical protein VKZ79_17035 [Alphaproteobacteria bacterium]|nr:hypothetical protein [Alphaproteobacteria bacterium]